MTCVRYKKQKRVGDDGPCDYCTAKTELDGLGKAKKCDKPVCPTCSAPTTSLKEDCATCLYGLNCYLEGYSVGSHDGGIVVREELRELVKELAEMLKSVTDHYRGDGCPVSTGVEDGCDTCRILDGVDRLTARADEVTRRVSKTAAESSDV